MEWWKVAESKKRIVVFCSVVLQEMNLKQHIVTRNSVSKHNRGYAFISDYIINQYMVALILHVHKEWVETYHLESSTQCAGKGSQPQQCMSLVTSHYVKCITSIQYSVHVHVGWCGTHVQYLLASLVFYQPNEFQGDLYFHVPWHITMIPGTCKCINAVQSNQSVCSPHWSCSQWKHVHDTARRTP